MVIKNMLSITYIYLHINGFEKTGLVIYSTSIRSKKTCCGEVTTHSESDGEYIRKDM